MPDSWQPPHTGRLGKVILGHEQVTLLGDAQRVAKPGADHVRRELALEFRLSAGSPLLKPYSAEQSRLARQ